MKFSLKLAFKNVSFTALSALAKFEFSSSFLFSFAMPRSACFDEMAMISSKSSP